MSITITTAPCCWELTTSNPDLPPWERVLNEVQAQAMVAWNLARTVIFHASWTK